VETILQRAREQFPDAHPRIISDNGPQFIAKDFKEFIRVAGMTHVRTSPYYPQSNGKIERWHKTLKGDCIRVQVPLSPDDARRVVTDFIAHYNHVRLHSAIGYVTPNDKLLGNDAAIHAERDRKLTEARERRKQMRQTRHDQLDARPDSSRPALDFAAVRGAPHRPGARATWLRAALRPRRPAAWRLPLARLYQRHRPLLQHQYKGPHLPLLQVRPLRQCPRPVGCREPLVDLRRRPGPVPALEHSAADLSRTPNRQQSPDRFGGVAGE
jgi:hypothetical protein